MYDFVRTHINVQKCKTQAVVALSSAEAELYGSVKVTAETMRLASMYRDFDTHMSGLVLEDTSAALVIVVRRGFDKLGVETDLNFKKVTNVDNGVDVFTNKLSWNEMQNHIHKLSSQFIQNLSSYMINYIHSDQLYSLRIVLYDT